ncbi:MAG: hypothetical protein V3V29_07770 [Acidimicrobiia bacterium]
MTSARALQTRAIRPESIEAESVEAESVEAESILVEGDRAVVERTLIDDGEAVRMLGTAPTGERPDLLRRLVAVGARGLTSMGIGIDITAIDTRVQHVVDSATDEAEQMIHRILEEGRVSLGEQFDPNHRSSILARALRDFTGWRDEFLEKLDPGVEGSTATLLFQRLHELVGPGGALEQRLTSALDPDADESAFSRLVRTIDERFEQLRRDLTSDRAAATARAEEAERGTNHGFVFEDVVEHHLRLWAATVKGTIVERTTSLTGDLAAAAKVGDFVVSLPGDRRIVVEAKRHASIGLGGSDGILAELDRAKANRRADAAVCIAGRDAFPAEVGRFNIYGDRVLAVDEGDGAMVAVAMQWATAMLEARGTGRPAADPAAVADRIDRIRSAADSLSGARRTVTTLRASLDKLHATLGELRGSVLDHLEDLDRLLCHGTAPESLGREELHS